jgi:hypothetical protein
MTSPAGAMWGSLISCVPIDNRHARRLAIAAQDAILPHRSSLVQTLGAEVQP